MLPVVGWFSYVQYVESSAEYQRPAYAYQRADYMFYNVSYARNVSLNDPFDPDLGYSTFSDRVERYLHNVARVTRYLGESVSSMRHVWEREQEMVHSGSLMFHCSPWAVSSWSARAYLQPRDKLLSHCASSLPFR
jgi:hypothetical protein